MKPARILIPVALIAALAAGWALDLPSRLGWRQPAAAGLTLYGNVDIRQVQLGARVSGRVSESRVEEGERVTAGLLLARLDPEPYEERVQAAAARVVAQAALLAKLEAGPRPAEIAQGRALVAEREAGLRDADLGLQRSRQLRRSGSVTQEVVDRAEAARDMAAARSDSAREALRLLTEGSRVEDLAAARANLRAAEAELAAARTALADTELRAPAAGTLLSRVREPGAVVAAGEPLFTLALDAPVWVRAYVSEPQLGLIQPGLPVAVYSDARPGAPYAGTVGFISPVAEFTPKSVETADLRTDLVYRLRVVIDRPDPGLRQGMPVTLQLPVTPPAGAAHDPARR